MTSPGGSLPSFPGLPDSPDRSADARASVARELKRAAEYAGSFSVDDFKSGDWLLALIEQLVRSYDRNAHAAFFQEKYRGLPPDEIADRLVSVAVRYAAITGAITGAAVTADEFLALPSGGLSLALITGAIGAEIICLSTIQMRLVLDLATIYGQELDPDDPEDVLTVFGYALGAAPAEVIGKVAQRAAGGGTKTAVKTVISKGTLQTVQDVGRLLGFRILQRTIIKYSVPVASAAVGSSYNYVATRSLGRIAKTHMRNRGRASTYLGRLTTSGPILGVALPAAMMAMAQADGHLKPAEKDLYMALTSHTAEDDWDAAEFDRLMRDRSALLDALADTDTADERHLIVEALALMAAYDGDLSEEETAFLTEVAARLEVDVDLAEVASQADEYRGVLRRGGGDDGEGALVRARDAAGRAVRSGAAAAEAVAGRAVRSGAAAAEAVAGRAARSGSAAEAVAERAARTGAAAAGRAARSGAAAAEAVAERAARSGAAAAASAASGARGKVTRRLSLLAEALERDTVEEPVDEPPAETPPGGE